MRGYKMKEWGGRGVWFASSRKELTPSIRLDLESTPSSHRVEGRVGREWDGLGNFLGEKFFPWWISLTTHTHHPSTLPEKILGFAMRVVPKDFGGVVVVVGRGCGVGVGATPHTNPKKSTSSSTTPTTQPTPTRQSKKLSKF